MIEVVPDVFLDLIFLGENNKKYLRGTTAICVLPRLLIAVLYWLDIIIKAYTVRYPGGQRLHEYRFSRCEVASMLEAVLREGGGGGRLRAPR